MSEHDQHSPFGTDEERISAIRRTRAAIEYAPAIDGPEIAEKAVRAYWNAREKGPAAAAEPADALVDRLAARLAALDTIAINAGEVGRMGRPWTEIALDGVWAFAPAVFLPLAVILWSPSIHLFPLPDEVWLAKFGRGVLPNVRWDIMVAVAVSIVALVTVVIALRNVSRRAVMKYRLQHSGGALAAGVLLAAMGTTYLTASSRQADTALDIVRAQDLITDQIVTSLRTYRATGNFAPVPTGEYSKYSLVANSIGRDRAVYSCLIAGGRDQWEADVTPFVARLSLKSATEPLLWSTSSNTRAIDRAITQVLIGHVTDRQPRVVTFRTADGKTLHLTLTSDPTTLSVGSEVIAVVEGASAVRMVKLEKLADSVFKPKSEL